MTSLLGRHKTQHNPTNRQHLTMGDPSPQAKASNSKSSGSKKPLKKSKNKSKFEDLAIQGTNNSSIASKLSVERIYFQKLKTNISISNEEEVIPYFKWFVGKAIRRSPCINRGYWLRLEAIRSRLLDIISRNDKKEICVVNLGCGFDPLPFQVLDTNNNDEISQYNAKNGKPISFVDIDYPDLIDVKKKLIASNDYLQNIVDENKDNYKMVTCDLNNIESYTKLLEKEIPSSETCQKVYIAEVSLAYMKPEFADKVILESSKLPNSHFILMEQLMPQGSDEPFARQMMKHFKKNESPLQSVSTYPTIKQQMKRFYDNGWKHINCSDMYELWENLSDELKQEVADVEPFDELEEFSLFAHSYIVMHATTDEKYDFLNKFQTPMAECINDFNFEHAKNNADFTWEDSEIDRKFGASAADGLYCGGYANTRLIDIIDTKTGETLACQSEELPTARVYHTFTKLSENKYMLLGGRTAPNRVLSDCWFWENQKWTRSKHELPEPLYRHNVMVLANDKCLILTGHSASHHYLFDEETGFTVADCDLPHLNSASLCANGNEGHLIGGEMKSGLFSSTMYTFSVDAAGKTNTTETYESPLFKRYAAKSAIKDNQIILVGGISNRFVFGQDTTIVIIEDGTPKLLNIPDHIWKDSMVMCGFEFQKTSENEFVLFGGGAVCYGFGSIWNNKKLRITFLD